MPDPKNPSLALLSKLGSAIVHADEYLDPAGHGHPFDRDTFQRLLADNEVREWLDGMHALALLPVKRRA